VTPSDLSRVREARRRLEDAAGGLEGNSDPALRIVELQSPRSAEPSLTLDRAFCVVSDLADGARQSLAATVDGVRMGNENIGLAGTVETYGRRFPLHHVSKIAPKVPGSAVVPVSTGAGRSSTRSSAVEMLLEVANQIDRALLVSAAELRGADSAMSDVESERALVTNADESAAVGSTLAVRSEDEEMLEALEMVAPPLGAIEELRTLVRQLREDGGRTQLEAALSQARAAREQVQPGDSKEVVVLAELAIAEADGALASYDMTPGSPTEALTSQLAELGFSSAPFEAAQVADRLIDESSELELIRERLLRSIDAAALPPEVLKLEAGRHRIDEQRLRIRRRLRSQQQLLAVAKEEATRLGVDLGRSDVLDLRDAPDRPTPILIEDPLADLPAHLSGAILSILLRISQETQIICVSDQPALESWCASVGERASWVRASGWFAGRSSTC